MASRSWWAQRVLAVFLFALVAWGCGGGGGDGAYDDVWRVEAVIGPEGGVLEVTDSGSGLGGLKITVPPGTVAQRTTFSIEDEWDVPDLPSGLSIDHPALRFGPAATFAGYLELAFPVTYVPTGPGDILGAYCWDPANGRWGVIPAREVSAGRMIVSTNRLGLCRWGTIRLGEVDDDTLRAWMDDLQGMYDDWTNLRDTLLAELQPFLDVIEQPSMAYRCSTQDSALNLLSSWRQEALSGVTAYLESAAVVSACRICDRDGTCQQSVCDADAIISGQPLEWLQDELQIWMRSVIVSSACPVDALGPLVEKLVAWAKYQEAIRELGCDWRCVLRNGTPDFYVDLLVGNVCSFSIFAIQLYRSYYGCS